MRLLSLFSRLAVPYWRAEPRARWDLAALVALTFLQSGVSVGFSFISRDFWTALNTKDIPLFYHQAQLFFAALSIATPIVVYYQYLRDTVSLRWRDWITRQVLTAYCSQRAFYNLEMDASVDNPDQRIAQDLGAFTTESIAFSLTILVSAVDLACFSTILFSIYPLLFGVLVLYAASGTAATALVGKQLITLNYQQLVREADLRYGLVRLRENAESIAFFGGEAREQSELTRRLSNAIDNMASVINLRRRLGFLQTGYKYAVQVLPAVCVAPRYFAGEIQLGAVTQSFSAFSHVLGDLSLVVNRFDSLSQFGAGIDRLAEFVQELERDVLTEKRVFNAEEDGNDVLGVDEKIERGESAEGVLEVHDLSIRTPGEGGDGRALVMGLSVSLAKGDRLLVAGPSGTGKSSLLRAVAGLWTRGRGCVESPGGGGMFFVPQKPYCTLGSLRANLVYPGKEDDVAAKDEERLLEVLKQVDLEELPGRMGGLDAQADWADILSLGEQQRLQFARLLLSGCAVAIIDEGSSALSVAAEQRLYGLVEQMGVTMVSVGHRPSLVNYHDRMLRLLGDGAWRLEDIGDVDRVEAAVSL